ncbi:MAG: TonB-dependent receptor [Alphaproteobacteria bacterium]|nr:TonB-dependent receptor [Alphaproteobacteria bacterium]
MRVLSVSLLALAAAMPAQAQDGFPIEDQISVIGSVLERSPANQSLETLGYDQIDARAATTVIDLLEISSAANITTNSRGETLVYLRNAGERQTALYFDGAALNIPWDNRINLSVIPADAIGGLSVQSGPASSLYGVNAAGGVIEIAPQRAHQLGSPGRLTLSAGDAEFSEAALRWAGENYESDWLFAVSHLEHDDEPDRLNTDLERTSLFARYHRELTDTTYASLSALYVDAGFGIAPAIFDRPTQGRQRFWRYPDTTQFLLTARGGRAFNASTDLHATLWYQEHDQQIDSYTDASYTMRDESQVDDDQALGFRALLDMRDVLGGDLRLSITSLSTRHVQSEFSAGSTRPAGEAFGDRRLSFGAEYERDIGDGLTLFGGGSLDRLDVTDTAGRPQGDDFETWNATVGLLWHINDSWSVRPSLARKARIPTLRELYGTALNRFLPNPDLEAETLTHFDVEFSYQIGETEWVITPFYWDQDGTLDQINLTVNGQRLRQRVNAQGADAVGVEARFSTRLSPMLTLEGGLTGMHLRRDDGVGLNEERFLSERPELIARLAASYDITPAFNLGAELSHRGQAYSFSDEDVFEPLPGSTSLNLSARYQPAGSQWEIFARLDNATDTEIIPQLGLPAAGRWARLGVRFDFGG